MRILVILCKFLGCVISHELCDRIRFLPGYAKSHILEMFYFFFLSPKGFFTGMVTCVAMSERFFTDMATYITMSVRFFTDMATCIAMSVRFLIPPYHISPSKPPLYHKQMAAVQSWHPLFPLGFVGPLLGTGWTGKKKMVSDQI